MQAKLCGFQRLGAQLIGSTLAAHATCDLPLPRAPDGAILAPQPPGSRGMSVK
jgi:hypothetical protein